MAEIRRKKNGKKKASVHATMYVWASWKSVVYYSTSFRDDVWEDDMHMLWRVRCIHNSAYTNHSAVHYSCSQHFSSLLPLLRPIKRSTGHRYCEILVLKNESTEIWWNVKTKTRCSSSPEDAHLQVSLAWHDWALTVVPAQLKCSKQTCYTLSSVN